VGRGGNNDLPFYTPDLHIVLADPLRLGDEAAYHPGEANARMADVVIINKCDSAEQAAIEQLEASIRSLNPEATVLLADSPVTLDDPNLVAGKQVVVIEDGPTLTHGSMSFGAGVVGARAAGVAGIVDPKPYAVGSLATTYAKYPNAVGILPAMGYGAAQVADLAATIEATPCEAVISGTPIDITRVLQVSKPMTRARYELREREPGAPGRAGSGYPRVTVFRTSQSCGVFGLLVPTECLSARHTPNRAGRWVDRRNGRWNGRWLRLAGRQVGRQVGSTGGFDRQAGRWT
jgi:predicted GTPase